MPSRIRILPENLANRIAAGEVVERPAAVVKELVENSIDSGATDIHVEIAGGGKRLIKVVDNGCGMSRDDALLSLERHATSKLSSSSQLDAIETLGFRGEALPSIASVSRMILSTRESSSLEGVEIYAEGGRLLTVKAHGMAVGTSIEVRGLFFNTPARLKFMRSPVTETGHVGEMLTRLAISRPEIRFTYVSDGKTQFRALQGDLASRVAAFLGKDSLNDLWPVESEGTDDIAVKGLIGGPALTRSATSGLYTYINGRYIRDRVVQHAILQAYRGVIERGRYPVLVLFLEMPIQDVDINVHPTKHEVRFREQGIVHDHICSALGVVLARSPWNRRSEPSAASYHASAADPALGRLSGVKDALARYQSSGGNQVFAFPSLSTSVPNRVLDSIRKDLHETPTGELNGYYSSLAVIGQYNAMFILCQDGQDLVLIDQHAAHERITFQRLRGEYARSGIESQALLFPDTVELSFDESAVLVEYAEMIEKLGYEIEHFGGNTHAVKSVPLLMASKEYLQALRDILSELGQLSRSSRADEILDNLLARLACHSVVRGSHQLAHQEMKALLRQMDVIGYSGTCPHGRPALVKISLAEIEKMFRRSPTVSND